ncbi:MAG: outer membrane lipoprotein chaperone LolA [Burkholderia sp.]|nr:outer membrane lipoprotein chaperone LolA [Burkholderia sp.]
MRQFYLFKCSINLSYRLLRSALIVSIMFFISPAFSNGIEQLKAFVLQVHAAKGNFIQQIVKYSSSDKSDKQAISNTEISSGIFIFSRPTKFIWEYQKPYNEVLQSDGNTLYIYDYDLNQVSEYKLSSEIGASPAAILFSNSNLLEKNYILHNAGKKDGIDWLNMSPKTKKNIQFKRISIGFQRNMFKIMRLYDLFGNLTLLTFSNIQINPILNNYQFKFTAPKGADMIKN